MTRRSCKALARVAALALLLPAWPAAATEAPPRAPLRLTLADAISRGRANNLAAVLAEAGVHAARGARLSALSGVLPSLTAALITSRQTISLDEYGFPVAPGESPLLGPFDVVRAQIAVSQAVIDVNAIERARAGGERLRAAHLSLADTREMVTAACAGLYLQAVVGASRVDAARAQLATARTLAERAHDMREAGTVAGIEVLRAEVQLAAQRQRLIQAENEAARQKLALGRAVGVPIEQDLELVDRVPYAAVTALEPEEATARALANRSDLRSAEALLRAAEDDRRAALGQALPSLHVDATLAGVGPSADTTRRVYGVAATLKVPLFEGGRAQGQMAQAAAAAEQQRARVTDMKAGIQYEVRWALLDLRAAAEQVDVAQGARSLAEQQLAQAADRFAEGVTGNVEVVQAQQALAEATEAHLAALLAHNLAKLSLARALGETEERAAQYLEGGE